MRNSKPPAGGLSAESRRTLIDSSGLEGSTTGSENKLLTLCPTLIPLASARLLLNLFEPLHLIGLQFKNFPYVLFQLLAAQGVDIHLDFNEFGRSNSA